MKKINSLLGILIILSVMLEANEKMIIQGLSYCGFRDKDILFPSAVLKPDSFAFKTAAYILKNPLKSEYCTEEMVKYISVFDYAGLYSYADGTHRKPKSRLKEEKDFIGILTQNSSDPVNLSFIFDTTMSDSMYYTYARLFLGRCMRSDEKRLESRLRAAQRIMEADSSEIAGLIERMKAAFPESIYFAEEGSKIVCTDRPVIIGTAGDDIYLLNAKNRIVIDMSGNDAYIAAEDYALGCAVNCIAFITDLSGDDIYSGKNFSLGVGMDSGVGFIDDRRGDDVYTGVFASMGAGFGGVGILTDREGNDRYTASGFAQGFGFTRGLGILNDISGNDLFTVYGGLPDSREEGYHSQLSQGFGFGIRDIASGGIGILIDNSGNDRYSGEYFVQGSSYWYALGILYDMNGNDEYRARRYSQGAGTHFTSGILSDRGGNDSYSSWGVSQGCGHDYANGILLDYSGNDIYSSVWLSQGAGNANGNGILIDFAGNDSYIHEKTDGQGWGNEDRMSYSFGMLYDCSGNDYFNLRRVKTMLKGAKGVLIDQEE